jgi:hypothetical protein
MYQFTDWQRKSFMLEYGKTLCYMYKQHTTENYVIIQVAQWEKITHISGVYFISRDEYKTLFYEKYDNHYYDENETEIITKLLEENQP